MPAGSAEHGGAVRGGAAGHECRARFEHPRLLEHHHQRFEDRRAGRLRAAAVPGRRDHRLRRRAGRLHLAVRRHQFEVDLRGRRHRQPADHAELGALQVRRPAGFAAGGVLRLAEGAAGQPLRHAVGDLLGRRLPQHAGRRDDARLLHAEDRRPDPVREELRAGHVPAARPGVRLHRHGQRRRRPALQRSGRFARAGVQPLHERPGQGQSHHQAAAGFDRLREEPVAGGGERLPVALRPRPGDRQGRHRLDRVRREHARAAEDRAARRCAGRLARQLQPAGQRRAGHPVGGRERRCGGPRRHRHGERHDGRGRPAAARGAGGR